MEKEFYKNLKLKTLNDISNGKITYEKLDDILKEDIDILMTFSSILISFIVSFFTIKWFISFVKKVGFLPFIIYRLFLGVSILWLI